MDRSNVKSANIHIVSGGSIRSAAADLLIALIPALLVSVLLFGIRALVLYFSCAAGAMAVYVLLRLCGRKKTAPVHIFTAAGAAVMSCMLLAPGSAPAQAMLCGAVAAAAAVFLPDRAGLVFSPALAAAAVIFAVFPEGAFYAPREGFSDFFRFSLDGVNLSVSSASPVMSSVRETVSLGKLIIGGSAGALGLTSALALAIGGVYLVLRKLASADAAAIAIAAMALLSVLFPEGRSVGAYAASMLLSGGFLYGALFFLCPMTCAPVTKAGRRIFALCYALLCFAVRKLAHTDGTVAVLLFLEVFTWSFDLALAPRFAKAGRIGPRIEALLVRQPKPGSVPAVPVTSPAPAKIPAGEPEQDIYEEEPAVFDGDIEIGIDAESFAADVTDGMVSQDDLALETEAFESEADAGTAETDDNEPETDADTPETDSDGIKADAREAGDGGSDGN